MAAFFIGMATVKDNAAFTEYAIASPATFTAFGGELIARGARSHELTGANGPDAAIVVKFATMDKLNAWYASGAYQALIPLRERALDLTITAYEELEL